MATVDKGTRTKILMVKQTRATRTVAATVTTSKVQLLQDETTTVVSMPI